MWSPIPPISNLVDLQGLIIPVCVHYNTYMHSIVTMLVASPEQDQIHGFLKAMNDSTMCAGELNLVCASEAPSLSTMRECVGFCQNPKMQEHLDSTR